MDEKKNSTEIEKYKAIIKKQSKENRRLNKEISNLKTQISNLQNTGSSNLKNKDETTKELKKRLTDSHLFSSKNYAFYIYNLLKNSSAYSIGMQIVSYTRKFTLLSKILKYSTIIVVWFETSAIFLLYSTIILAIIPILLVFAIALLAYGFTQHSKCNEKMILETYGKRVYVIFADRSNKQNEKDEIAGSAFLERHAKQLTEDQNNIVIIISPFFFGSHGIIDNGKLYISMRCEFDRVWILRKHYFFSFKRVIIKSLGDDAVIIH